MKRSTVRWMARVVMLVVLSTTWTIGVAQAADERLDDAQAALEKARALVVASQPGNVSTKNEREFEKRRAKAIEYIDRAIEEIEAAKAASDAG